MRVFIMYDENGEILSVSQVEAMPEGVEHPFYLTDPKHAVVEIDPEDEIAKRLNADNSPEQHVALSLHKDYRFDKKSKRVRKAAEMETEQPKPVESEQPKPKPQPKHSKAGDGQR